MLGLLLGTFGLAAVQVRSVVERRGELALMRAIGFRRRRLASLVMLENLLLLFAGLGLGLLAAVLAVLPYWWLSEAGLPASSLLAMLVIVAVVGVFTSLASVWAALQAPLIAALRGE
jgi:ABC-type antimicrobial peptide transport system permease subunit